MHKFQCDCERTSYVNVANMNHRRHIVLKPTRQPVNDFMIIIFKARINCGTTHKLRESGMSKWPSKYGRRSSSEIQCYLNLIERFNNIPTQLNADFCYRIFTTHSLIWCFLLSLFSLQVGLFNHLGGSMLGVAVGLVIYKYLVDLLIDFCCCSGMLEIRLFHMQHLHMNIFMHSLQFTVCTLFGIIE